MINTRKSLRNALIVYGGLASSYCYSGMITQTNSFEFNFNEYSGYRSEFVNGNESFVSELQRVISINGFDESLGELINVSVRITGISELAIWTWMPSGSSINWTQSTTDTILNLEGFGNVFGNTISYVCSGMTSCTNVEHNSINFNTQYSALDPEIFLSDSPIELDLGLTLESSVLLGFGDTLGYLHRGDFSGNYEILYEYTSVPEPNSFALLFPALMFVGYKIKRARLGANC